MIRQAKERDFPAVATNECLVRILGLQNAYGANAPFIHYFTDGNEGLMSLMDGVAVLHLPMLTEEWAIFLAMNPDIQSIHTEHSVGEALVATGSWFGGAGEVMIYKGTPCQVDSCVCVSPSLPLVHKLLDEYFPAVSRLDSWYPDVSHRLRHGCCHISTLQCEDKIVSTAMTVAETNDAAVLGQIATHADFRRQGMAETCIKSTIAQCEGKSLYILPMNEIARNLYSKLGFVTCGGWSELQRSL